MNTRILLLLLLALQPMLAQAACKGDAQRERAEIKAHYASLLQDVEARKDKRFHEAYMRLSREYPPEDQAVIKEAMQEGRQRTEELARRREAGVRGRELQRDYADKTRAAHKKYFEERMSVRKDHLTRYREEIAAAREEARAERDAVQEMKAQEILAHHKFVQSGCKQSLKRRIRNGLEAISPQPNPNHDDPVVYGATGRRG